MSNLLFVQMSGVPGAGKTTVAHAIAGQIGAVVIDHDVTKSALLDANVPVAIAGHASYRVLDAMVRHLLQQGHSVIFDSPCLYTELLERGQLLAEETGAQYRYVECILADLDELDQRLRTRPRWRSQLAGVYTPLTEGSGKAQAGAEIFREWMVTMKRPVNGYLTLDTSRPLAVCVQETLSYLKTAKTDSNVLIDGNAIPLIPFKKFCF